MAQHHAASFSASAEIMGAMVMGENLLTAAHRQLLAEIASDPYLTGTFYFTGGTALSLFYLNHRYSEDLDFFSESPYEPIALEAHCKTVFRRLRATSVELTLLNAQHTYFITLGKQRIKVDFAQYPFSHLGTFLKKDDLRVASLLDIAVNKVHAITTRKRGRDFLDLFLAQQKLNLSVSELLKNYRLKFDVYLAPQELAKHYAGVLDALDQPRFLGELPWDEVEKYFLSEAKKLRVAT